MKIVEEENEKMFTKDERNNIISEKHNPLKVNYKNLFEKEGLFMNRTKEVLLDEEENTLIKNFSKSEKFIKLLIKICYDFKIDDYKKEIKVFLENN